MMTPEQKHLVATVAEEAGEVAQAAAKILRFGMCDTHPKTGNEENIVLMTREANELIGVMRMLLDTLPKRYDAQFPDREVIEAKISRTKEWMGYAKARGMME